MSSSTVKIVSFVELILTIIFGIIVGISTAGPFNFSSMLMVFGGGLVLFCFLMIGAGILQQLEYTNNCLSHFLDKDRKEELQKWKKENESVPGFIAQEKPKS